MGTVQRAIPPKKQPVGPSGDVDDVPSIVTEGGFTTYGKEPAKFVLKSDTSEFIF